MQRFHDQPIRKKIAGIILVSASATTLLIGILFVTYDRSSFRDTMERNLQTQARVIGVNSTAAIAFNNPDDAEETLSGLRAMPNIIAASVRTLDGKLFARYMRDVTGGTSPPFEKHSKGVFFDRNHLEVVESILLDGEEIGTICICSDLRELHARTELHVGFVAVTGTVIFILGFLGSFRLQRLISDPILRLAEVARNVSTSKDYSVRATKHCEDELGYLTESFNEMLDQVKKRDTALQQSEEHFRVLTENSFDVIAICDETGVVRYVCSSMEKQSGYSSEEVIGEAALAFIHTEDTRAAKSMFCKVLRMPGVPIATELRLMLKDGSWRFAHCISRNLLGNPAVAGIVMNVRDITERKRAEEELNTYAHRLEQSNRELQDFAYVSSHDLQEPLRKIQAFGGRLEARCSDQLDERAQDYLARMQNAAARMQTLINDLLEFSRVTTQAKPFAPVDLAKIAHEVVSDLEVRVEETRGRIEIGDLPVIEADALQIRQLFQNLIGNALKFRRDEETPVVKLEGSCDGSDGGKARFSVADNGIGFDEKYADRIFGVFQRLHGRGKYEGTGVGLAICRRIIERHGGQIAVQSKPGEGTTFLITIPTRQSGGC